MNLSTKESGHLCELKFVLRATEKGFFVNRPLGDFRAYDYILDKNNTLNRIQVKSANKIKKKPEQAISYKIMLAQGSGHKHVYNIKDIDYFIIYLVQDDLFYIIPRSVTGNTLSISLFPDSRDSKYNIYKENWGLLQ